MQRADVYPALARDRAVPVMEATMRYSVACRAITKGDVVVHRGHGGRWSDVPVSPKGPPVPCPVCSRPMVQTGEVRVSRVIEAPDHPGRGAP